MKCCACEAPVDPGRAKCPVCGFPVIQSTGSNENELDRIRILGHTYLKKKIRNITVGMTTYQYQMSDGHLTLKSEDKKSLFDVGDIDQIGTVMWCDEDFARVDAVGFPQKVQLNIYVDNGRSVDTPVLIGIPDIRGFCHIGMVLKEGLCAQMLMGDERTYTLSEKFSLV